MGRNEQGALVRLDIVRAPAVLQVALCLGDGALLHGGEQPGEACEVQAGQTVAVTGKGEKLIQIPQRQRGQHVVVAAQLPQLGVGVQIQRCQVVVAAVERLQRGVGAQIQRLDLVPAAIQGNQGGVGAEIQTLHAVTASAIQVFQRDIGAQIRCVHAGVVPGEEERLETGKVGQDHIVQLIAAHVQKTQPRIGCQIQIAGEHVAASVQVAQLREELDALEGGDLLVRADDGGDCQAFLIREPAAAVRVDVLGHVSTEGQVGEVHRVHGDLRRREVDLGAIHRIVARVEFNGLPLGGGAVEVNVGQAGTAVEGVLLNALKGPGKVDPGQFLTVEEGAGGDRGKTGGQGRGLQTAAVPEEIIAQSLHRVGDGDDDQIGAAHKSPLSDAGDRGGDLHVCQLIQPGEGIVANARYQLVHLDGFDQRDELAVVVLIPGRVLPIHVVRDLQVVLVHDFIAPIDAEGAAVRIERPEQVHGTGTIGAGHDTANIRIVPLGAQQGIVVAVDGQLIFSHQL